MRREPSTLRRVGAVFSWLRRHPRTLLHAALAAAATCIWLHYRSHIAADLLPAYRLAPWVAVLAFVVGAFERPDWSPIADFYGSCRLGREVFEQLGLPRMTEKPMIRAKPRLRTLPGGGRRLVWIPGSNTQQEIESAALQVYEHPKIWARAHTSRFIGWQNHRALDFVPRDRADATDATNTFAPEEY